jgi:hypothetical protein
MSSIFKLKTDVSELASTNQGSSRMQYQQLPPTRDVTGGAFANGQINFRTQTAGTTWCVPSRSYIRTRFSLTKWNGAAYVPVELDDNIAPNMSLMSNLFQSAEFRINDTTVSRVADYMPQIDALENRLTKSKSWLESVGKSTNFWDISQAERMAQVVSDTSNPVEIGETTKSDAILGYAGANTVAYNAGTGVVTFSAVNANVHFKVGDKIAFTGGTLADGALNVECKVVSVSAGLTMVVEANIGLDVAANADITFNRIRTTTESNLSNAGKFELCWTPPLSIFKVQSALPPGMKLELVLTPQTSTSFQKRAIESVLGQASKVPVIAGATPNLDEYKLNIEDMYLYASTVDGPRYDNGTFLLDLESSACQTEQLSNGSFQQKNLDISPSSYALTVAYQDGRAGENTAISASKFKSYEAGNTPSTPQELKLSRMFISFGGVQKPSPDADPSFVAGTDYTTQRYYESNIGSGALFDSGGSETLKEWQDRGAYYYFPWPRAGSDASTRVNVHQQFDVANNTDIENTRLLLFSHSRQVARVRIQNSVVTSVDLEEA